MNIEIPVKPFLACDAKTQDAIDRACVPLGSAKRGDLIGIRFQCWHMEASYQKEDIEMVLYAGPSERPRAVPADIYFADTARPINRAQVVAFSAVTRADLFKAQEACGPHWRSSLKNGFDLLEVVLMKDASIIADDCHDYSAKGRTIAFLKPATSTHEALARQKDVSVAENILKWSAIPVAEHTTVDISPLRIPVM